MSRLIDRACELEQSPRELALKAHVERPIQTGSGICGHCGEVIDPARLAVNPAFERCIDCQTQFELWEKKFGAGIS
ncbi:TraR/DksA family transcriptional regulator [Photorhabdus noenieputensis]|uniref:TraR/DksA C4-type zinc finger protein n=1 Tax=Photorhabdus noenieputensis TaxID=1208607 RepID=UPI001BD2068E|nr:TraR/DksA C4-type zinc finger protein [Photorhabdus noenieputensis]MBS9438980.1 TraR/DksA family transcriptional regulator [Photorhabdus noenieputensis]MCK3669730.1 TraR/DksA C4-type zinc finger protein [Photorhabdus noenieputensis]